MKEAYLYLSSHTSKDIYPFNTANDFKAKLPLTLNLNGAVGKWRMALLDIDLPKLEEGYKPNYITLETSLCAPSVYHNSLRPILQRLYYSEIKKGQPITIDSPRYVTINTSNIESFDLYILDQTDQKVSFKTGHVYCSLHLVREEE